MASETSTKHDVGQLERVLLDENAEPMHVPLSLLEEITNCFSHEHQIGSGGFAVVYKGIVGKGMIAVKKLSRTFDLPENKFHKELECLMKARHKNIVRFLGYCSETQGRIADYQGKFVMSDIRNWLLCFEYVPNGSLDKYITDASRGLEWRDRYEIIKGICRGLLYLHKLHILHLDLKPSNILMDDRMVPKIADFGLSRCLDKEQTRVFTSNLCGTQGYFAPELFRGQVGYTSDIYSLGVIIVEILTGEKRYPEDDNVVDFLEKEVVDKWMHRLEGSDHWDVQLDQVRVCMKIGIECMDLDRKKRPVARHIIDRLDGTASSVETSIGSSSVEEQVSFLIENYHQEKNTELVAGYYPGKDQEEQAETEELVEYVGNWQQGQEEALGVQWSLWRAQDRKQNVIPEDVSISGSNSGMLYKLKNLSIFNRKAHRREYEKAGRPESQMVNALKVFKKVELEPILKSPNTILKDEFGEVYNGILDNVRVTLRSVGAVLDAETFQNEMFIQSRCIHKNILRLKGCCFEYDNPILVYEFSEGNLQELLHSCNKVPLNLGARLSIAAASAGGLAYMHSMENVIHGGFKPASILFHENFVPKITSSMLWMISKNVRDITYMDPVYQRTGLMTTKSDVYSFGIVIVELLTRKEASHSDNNSLVKNFVDNYEQGMKSTELLDEEIAVTGDLELLGDLAEIAVQCLNIDVDQRPTMMDVAKRLSILNKARKLARLQAS